jgi:hypothetical protein
MSHEDEEKKRRRPPKASVVRPEFPGQEDIECWQVMHIDGGQDEDNFMAAIINPAATVWMDGKNLTYADAAALTAKLTIPGATLLRHADSVEESAMTRSR